MGLKKTSTNPFDRGDFLFTLDITDRLFFGKERADNSQVFRRDVCVCHFRFSES